VTVRTSIDRTAMFVGDRVTYTIEITCVLLASIVVVCGASSVRGWVTDRRSASRRAIDFWIPFRKSIRRAFECPVPAAAA
jgi:hypothetical protein